MTVQRFARVAGLVLAATVLAAGCATSPQATGSSGGSGTTITVVAAENFWGSIAKQLGGSHVTVTSIIANPDTDPHA
ncbi:MAG TPA: metal ABC transporter substrate-binding protein, partial [Pseudonocardiaceae bacterium]